MSQKLLSFPLRLAAVAFAILLAGCQGGGNEVLESAAAEKPAPKTDETVGAGGTQVTMFLPGTGQQSQDLRDGAAMAVEDLGAGKLSVTFRYGAGAVPQLVLGVASGLPATGTAISFTSNSAARGAGVFAMRTDAIDSALEGARAAAKAGKRALAVIVPKSFSEGDKARLAQGLGNGKLQLVGFAAYSGAGAALAPQVAGMKPVLSGADAIMIFGSGDVPADIVVAVRAASLVPASTLVIGNIDWSRSSFSRPELTGALIALPDQATLQLVSQRYREKAGRSLTVDAAYGYDAIAVAAGIVRSIGPQGLTAETLTKSSGFRGTLGLFRFLPNGSVQRPLTLYSLANGTLKVLDPEPDGF